MVEENNTRWQYKFVKYNKVFKQLSGFVAKVELTEIEVQGVIKAFEYTFDFGLKTLQILLEGEGCQDISEPQSAIRRSFQDRYISDEKGWIKMFKQRNFTIFTYDEQNAEEMVEDIRDIYLNLFKELQVRLNKEK